MTMREPPHPTAEHDTYMAPGGTSGPSISGFIPPLATPENIAAGRRLIAQGEPYFVVRYTADMYESLYEIPDNAIQRGTEERIEAGRADHLYEYDESHHRGEVVLVGPDVLTAPAEVLDMHTRRLLLKTREISLAFVDIAYLHKRTREDANRAYRIRVSRASAENYIDKLVSHAKAAGLRPMVHSQCPALRRGYGRAMEYAAAFLTQRGAFTPSGIKRVPEVESEQHKLVGDALFYIEVLQIKGDTTAMQLAAMMIMLHLGGPAAAAVLYAQQHGLGAKDGDVRDVIEWLNTELSMLAGKQPLQIARACRAIYTAMVKFCPKPRSRANPWNKQGDFNLAKELAVAELRSDRQVRSDFRKFGLARLDALADETEAQIDALGDGTSQKVAANRRKLQGRLTQLHALIGLARRSR